MVFLNNVFNKKDNCFSVGTEDVVFLTQKTITSNEKEHHIGFHADNNNSSLCKTELEKPTGAVVHNADHEL